jgi:hypothetical protein
MRSKNVPVINISDDFKAPSLPMLFQQILIHPHHNVVLECPLDYLVEEIWR